jgi:hypothetical protein
MTNEELKIFWTPLYMNNDKHNHNATWLQEISLVTEHTMEYQSITEENIKAAATKTANWKAAGPDKIQNLWWKRLSCVHTYLAKYFTEIISSPEKLSTISQKLLCT